MGPTRTATWARVPTPRAATTTPRHHVSRGGSPCVVADRSDMTSKHWAVNAIVNPLRSLMGRTLFIQNTGLKTTTVQANAAAGLPTRSRATQ